MMIVQNGVFDQIHVVYVIIEGQLLDQVIDSDHGGVPKHLGQIADSIDEWEGAVAESLGLGLAVVAGIKEKHPGKLNLQA